MKKKSLKGLKLNKKNISNLSQEQVTGGLPSKYCTIGCTDGCTPAQTIWNCTRGNCTGDCDNGWSYICSLICPDDNK
ncbi:MAG: hypothetical protein AAF611_13610 [Bacteroidota bacterium]